LSVSDSENLYTNISNKVELYDEIGFSAPEYFELRKDASGHILSISPGELFLGDSSDRAFYFKVRIGRSLTDEELETESLDIPTKAWASQKISEPLMVDGGEINILPQIVPAIIQSSFGEELTFKASVDFSKIKLPFSDLSTSEVSANAGNVSIKWFNDSDDSLLVDGPLVEFPIQGHGYYDSFSGFLGYLYYEATDNWGHTQRSPKIAINNQYKYSSPTLVAHPCDTTSSEFSNIETNEIAGGFHNWRKAGIRFDGTGDVMDGFGTRLISKSDTSYAAEAVTFDFYGNMKVIGKTACSN
jgi:hypothetical protein